MIKKIQKHLLLNNPLLWNIRIIPLLLIILLVHLLFFGIGYWVTDVTFSENYYYYYSHFRELGLLYFFTVLTGLLILIGWLIFFNRNNGFRTFYPLKPSQLYLQWLLIFIITAGLALIPYTMSQGYDVKWKSQASLEETKKALEIIDKVTLLLPSGYSYDYNDNNYTYKENIDYPIPVPENRELDVYSLNLGKYDYYYDEKGKIQITGYIGPSILFYKSYNYNEENKKYLSLDQIKQISYDEKLKNWLKTGEKDSVINVMKDFYDLHQKHNLKTNLSPELWFAKIYNPPFFELNDDPLIKKNKSYSNDKFYFQYDELKSAYRHIESIYDYNNEDMQWFLLVSLCIAIVISFLIFSFRVTTGKSWLIAFITIGVLFFSVILLSIAFGNIHHREEEIIILFNTLFWIALFFVLLTGIIMKIKSKGNKGRSNIYINLFLWLIPAIIPLAFFTVFVYADLIGSDINIESENVFYMFWINSIIMIAIMFPISVLVRKWKGLAEK